MKIVKLGLMAFLFLSLNLFTAYGQARIKVVDGLISLDDFSPTIKKYAAFSDSLDRNLKLHPNDTTTLFYRALLYLQFNGIVANPDLGSIQARESLVYGLKLANRADSLKMKSFNLKLVRAQLCRELTNRFAPVDVWKYSAVQIAERRKRFDYFKSKANTIYDELEILDSKNAYAYKRLKVK